MTKEEIVKEWIVLPDGGLKELFLSDLNEVIRDELIKFCDKYWLSSHNKVVEMVDRYFNTEQK